MNTIFVLLSAGQKPAPLVDLDNTVFVQFGIFMILLFVLTKFVFRPYLALLRERNENIDGAKLEAGKLSTQADEKLAHYEEQIVKARKEAALVRAEHRDEGGASAADLLTEARDKAEAKVAEAREKINKSAEAAALSLRTRADKIARTVATKLLGREV